MLFAFAFTRDFLLGMILVIAATLLYGGAWDVLAILPCAVCCTPSKSAKIASCDPADSASLEQPLLTDHQSEYCDAEEARREDLDMPLNARTRSESRELRTMPMACRG